MMPKKTFGWAMREMMLGAGTDGWLPASGRRALPFCGSGSAPATGGGTGGGAGAGGGMPGRHLRRQHHRVDNARLLQPGRRGGDRGGERTAVFEHQAEQAEADRPTRFEHGFLDPLAVLPDPVLAVQIDEGVAIVLEAKFRVIPRNGLLGIAQYEVVLGDPANAQITIGELDVLLGAIPVEHDQPWHASVCLSVARADIGSRNEATYRPR